MFDWFKKLWGWGGNGVARSPALLGHTPTPEDLRSMVRPEDTVTLLKRDITSRRRDITEKLNVLRAAADDQAADGSGPSSS